MCYDVIHVSLHIIYSLHDIRILSKKMGITKIKFEMEENVIKVKKNKAQMIKQIQARCYHHKVQRMALLGYF